MTLTTWFATSPTVAAYRAATDRCAVAFAPLRANQPYDARRILVSRDTADRTRDRIDAINARAESRGLSGRLTITVTPVALTDVNQWTKIETTRIVYEIVIGGTPPRYGDWDLIAVLDDDPYAGLIVSPVPGAPQVDRDALSEVGYCDHCHTTRYRTHTYVVRHAHTDEQRQVGKTCLADFTGHTGSIAYPSIDVTSEYNEDGEWLGGGTAAPADTDVVTVLAYAWACIKLYGFVPTSDDWRTTTRDRVINALYPGKSPELRAAAAELAPHADEARERAAEIVEFINSDEFSGTSDYVFNLKAIAEAEYVTVQNYGLLVSAPQAHARHVERTLIRQRIAAVNEHVGTVGERGVHTVMVTGIKYIPGNYGTTILYLMRDDAGRDMKWFASRDVLGHDVEGCRFVIKATIKAHDEYQGRKVTMISRAVLIETLDAT